LKRNEAKRSEKIGFSFSLEHAKTKRNGSYFASFRIEEKRIFKRNRRTLTTKQNQIFLDKKSRNVERLGLFALHIVEILHGITQHCFGGAV
jgi:hypothetical protein